MSFPLSVMICREPTVKSSDAGGRSPCRDIPGSICPQRPGKLPVDRLRSGCIACDEIDTGVDRLAVGETVRRILDPYA